MNKQRKESTTKGLLISNMQNGDYFYEKGIESYRGKDLRKAKRYLERAIQLDPTDAAYLCQLAIILSDLGDYHRSNECLNNIVDNNLDGQLHVCFFFLANNYANLGLFEHARKEALRYIDSDPEGEFLEEIEDLLELIVDEDDLFADEENFLIRYELASQELKKKNSEKAIDYFMELIKEEPSYWMAHIRLAEACYRNGEKQKAVEILESILEKEENVTARCYLMIYHFELGNKQKSEEILDTLRNVYPIDPEQRYLLAVSFGKVGCHELAYEGLESLQKNGYGDFQKFIYHVAVASFWTNRIEKALMLWEKLATLENELAQANLELYQQGKLANLSYEYRSHTFEYQD